MSLFYVPLSYVLWHYTLGLRQLFFVWKDLTWYVAHLFSLTLLLRTLLSPWKRMNEYYNGGGLEEWATVKVVNIFSRLVGFVIRIPIILVGLISVIGMCAALVFFVAAWLLAPAILVALVYLGSSFLV